MRGILRSRYGLFQVSSQVSVPHFTCSLETNHKSFRSLSFPSLSLSLTLTRSWSIVLAKHLVFGLVRVEHQKMRQIVESKGLKQCVCSWNGKG